MGLALLGLSTGESCTEANLISFEASIVTVVPVHVMYLLGIGHFSFSTCQKYIQDKWEKSFLLCHRSVHMKVCSGTKLGPNPSQERFVRIDLPANSLNSGTAHMSKKSALPM